jgi:hypothetical protein
MTLQLDVSNSPHVFATMAGVGDNGTRYAAGKNQPGKCTRWNWLAAGGGAGFENTTTLASAVAGWNATPGEHRHGLGERPFRGAIGVFGATSGPRWAGDVNYPYGDYVTFTGGGLDSANWRDWEVVGTDAAGVGNIAVVTMGVRYVQTGYRPVLGWQSMLGGAVLLNGVPAPSPIPDVPEEDEDMKILIAQTQWSQHPEVRDTWAFNYETKTYTHVDTDKFVIGAQAAGAVVLSGPQPQSMFAGFTCVDKSGGIR